MFHKRLKELRQGKNMTQQELADVLSTKIDGVKLKKQTISSYENNTEPNIGMLKNIAEVFNVTVDYLTGNSDYKTSELEHIKDTTSIDISLIESINRISHTEKLFLYKLLNENNDTLTNFLHALYLFNQGDRETIASNFFKDEEYSTLKAVFLGKTIYKSLVTKFLDALLEEISKPDIAQSDLTVLFASELRRIEDSLT